MTTPLFTYQPAKPMTTIRADILRTISNGARQLGIGAPNVGPRSDGYLRATGLATELAVVQANNVVLADDGMADTAAAASLDRFLAEYGLSRNPALGSGGLITAPTSVISGVVAVASNAQLTDANGLRYQVPVGGNFPTDTNGNATIVILAIDAGKETDHTNGDVLTWTSPPAFFAANVTVGLFGGTDGLSGGADSEVGFDEPPRTRLLDRLQNPPAGGNWSALLDSVVAASPYVQGAGAYPALLGPSTGFYVMWAAPQTAGILTSTSKSRQVPSAVVTGTVTPTVVGQYPEHAFLVGASAVDQPTDIAILLSIPSAPSAAPPGPGGGWLDGSPWPSSVNGTAATAVTAITTPGLIFTVNAISSPSPGVSHVSWLSAATWQVTSAIVVAVSGTPGAYTITVDTPFVGLAVGDYIFPSAINTGVYMTAAFAAFASLGAGEWSTNGAVIERAFRHPLPFTAWPYALDNAFLKQLENSSAEVSGANWIFRSAVTPAVPGSITFNTTTLALTSTPPAILTPRRIGFYAA